MAGSQSSLQLGARPRGLARSAQILAFFTELKQNIRAAGGSVLLFQLDADELRQLDEAIAQFRERVAYARDLAIADERAAADRRRST